MSWVQGLGPLWSSGAPATELQDPERTQGSRVWSLGFKVQGLGFRVQGLGSRVYLGTFHFLPSGVEEDLASEHISEGLRSANVFSQTRHMRQGKILYTLHPRP